MMIATLSAALRRGILALVLATGCAGTAAAATPVSGVWRDDHNRIYLIGPADGAYRIAVLVVEQGMPNWFTATCPAAWTGLCRTSLWRYRIETSQQGEQSYARVSPTTFEIEFTATTAGRVRYPSVDTGETGPNRNLVGITPTAVTRQPASPRAAGVSWWHGGGSRWAPTLYFLAAPADAKNSGEANDDIAEVYALAVTEAGTRTWSRAVGSMLYAPSQVGHEFGGQTMRPLSGNNFPYPARTTPQFTTISQSASMILREDVALVTDLGPDAAGPVAATRDR